MFYLIGVTFQIIYFEIQILTKRHFRVKKNYMKFLQPVLLLLLLANLSLNAQILTESNLPIIIIDTDSNEIPDEPKIPAIMGIIDNGVGQINKIDNVFNHYDGHIGIETRGNSTQLYEKKTYTIELWDEAENEISEPLLGMGKEEDWILHAMVLDKTQLRVPLCFDLFRKMGHYAANYRYVELIVDGEYQGVYILTEKLKRDDDRVDIAKLDEDDIAGDSLTGGYILRIDWTWDVQEEDLFESNYESQGGIPMKYQWYYPKPDKIKQEQKEYISNYIHDFEDAAFGPDFTNQAGLRYTDYIDLNSFVDFVIINEFAKNSDGYKLSSYMHKDKDSKGGKLTAGPIWDFDQSYGLSTVCSSHNPLGWIYLKNQEGCGDLGTMPLWWRVMMEDPIFINRLDCRWKEFRSSFLQLDSLFQWMDTQTTLLEDPLGRNFERWDFIGNNIWFEPFPIPETYDEEINYMKNWIQDRLEWMDANMFGNCDEDITNTKEVLSDNNFSFAPNPTMDNIRLYNLKGERILIHDAKGKMHISTPINASEKRLDLSTLSNGIYFITVEAAGNRITKKLIVL